MLPPAYFEYLQKNVLSEPRRPEPIAPTLLRYLGSVVSCMERSADLDIRVFQAVHFEEIFFILENVIQRNYGIRQREHYMDQLNDIHMHYDDVLRSTRV